MDVLEQEDALTMTVIGWTNTPNECEVKAIKRYKDSGCKLVNGNDGGFDAKQLRKTSERHPNIKKAYRRLEGGVRSVKKYGGDHQRFEARLLEFKAIIAKKRAMGADHMMAVDVALGEYFARS